MLIYIWQIENVQMFRTPTPAQLYIALALFDGCTARAVLLCF